MNGCSPRLPAETTCVCPYCGQLGGLSFSFAQRHYFRCPDCDLIYLRRPPERGADADEELSYYRDRYYSDHADDQPIRDAMHLNSRILDAVESRCGKGRLLDVGCGLGLFLRTALDRGWSVAGVDPSQQSIERAREFAGNAATVGTLRDVVGTGPFDAVTMINVLDHLRTPWTDLALAGNLIRPGGCLYLRFPNGLFHSSLIRLQTVLTDRMIINRLLVFHEYAFTPQFMRRLLIVHGFEHIRLANARMSGAAIYRDSPVLKRLSAGLNGLLLLIASSCRAVSGNRWLLGPSLEVTAVKKGQG